MDDMLEGKSLADDENLEPSFEEGLIQRVRKDYDSAGKFLKAFHDMCYTVYSLYHNSSKYEDMKTKNRFPVPFFQEQVDNFVAYMMDKLFYKNRPCTVVGVEETDKADAEAKQSMLDWQDYKDRIYGKYSRLVKDIAMCRIGVAQIDYTEKVKTKIIGQQVPEPDETGQMQMVSRAIPQQIIDYKGPTVKRIDPTDFFITQEKQEVDDEHPLMIRSRHPLEYFKSQDYFFNYDKLETELPGAGKKGSPETSDIQHNKRMVRDYNPEQTSTDNSLTYVEWHGMVDKKALYEYLGYPLEEEVPTQEGIPIMVPTVKDGEKARIICGVVEGKVMVRCEETPFDFDSPNVVVGIMQHDDNELMGVSLADKIVAVQHGMEVLMGILLENLKQSVNAGHVINTSALKPGASAVVNEAGFVLETNDNVNNVHKRVEQPKISSDIYILLNEMFPQMGQDAGGMQDILTGRGEPGVETLGESEMVAGTASVRMTKYLKCIEETLVEPMYAMRNQINMQMLDEDFVYGVIGEGVIEWRTITPGQIRANVDFLCESASRETNRLVITQQILQLGKTIVPLMTQLGFPVRVDELAAQLCEQGFSWTRDMTEKIFPSLKLEQEGMDINQNLITNMMIQQQMPQLQALAGAGAQVGMGQEPQPRNEQEASASLNESNRTQIGRE